ncbi:MAG: hypothetical protein JEZ06_09345 [Anaerolineaceae bacterium]|nr:hypothetical protein [Anaerolineaceae bacterium]
MTAVPEFMLRKLFVKESLISDESGFSFVIHNTLAPVTLNGFDLVANGQEISPEDVIMQAGNEEISAVEIGVDNPFVLSIGSKIKVKVKGTEKGDGNLRITVNTQEIGPLSFSIKADDGTDERSKPAFKLKIPKFLQKPLKAEIKISPDTVIGEINPFVYGHFVEHLENCVYDGIWKKDGSELRKDTLRLIKDMRPTMMRYPGGNFASGYHWEDGIGPKPERPERHDDAWNSWDSNQVGTDEFMAFCEKVEAEPFIVVNDGSGTPEEAARWVAYCNQPADTEQGSRRAENGHPEPYGVKIWGVGNEVWGEWQIGHTTAEEYVQRLRNFIEAMRAVDPEIEIVAVGDKVMTDNVNDPGRRWNETVLREAGDLIDYLSFHIYQPDREGWQETYDLDELHKSVCAAPLTVEKIIKRIAKQIKTFAPQRDIKIALDEWNLWLPPSPDAESIHNINYVMRDALYVGGMLNMFHRQSKVLAIANIAQLVNVLPLIVTNEKDAYATPLYYPFKFYADMQSQVVKTETSTKHFDSLALGLMDACQDVPYLDVTVTRDKYGRKIVIGMVNRHPTRKIEMRIKFLSLEAWSLERGWLLKSPDPLTANTFEEPQAVIAKEVRLPSLTKNNFRVELHPASVATLVLKKVSR